MSDQTARRTTAASHGRRALLILSLLSGLGGVVYEVLYMRHLTTVLGDMFYVHAGLLCMFLFGNGVGAWVARRFVRHLWVFEMTIGLYAIALPAMIPVYESSALSHLFPNPVVQSLFASALLLFVPSVCIGLSIPLFSAYVRGQGQDEDAFKLTYLLYNLGAALSVVLVEFYLIRWVGLSVALYVIASVNLSCGVVLFVKRRAWAPDPAVVEAESAPGFPWRTSTALFLVSLAASLFVAFYIKVCYHLFMPNRENFAICTSVSLLAIAVGTHVARRRRWDFATFVVFGMVTMAAVYLLFPPVVLSYLGLDRFAPMWTSTLRKFGFAFLLVLPYVFFGGTIPALLAQERDVARRAGTLLMLSGVGNVVGMLSYIFLIHPRLSVFAPPVLAWVLLLVSLGLYGIGSLRRVQIALVGLSALALPVIVMRPQSGVYLMHDRALAGSTIDHYKAASDNVSFVDGPDRSYINYNGFPEISVTVHGRVNRAEVVSGIIPALVAPRRDSALVLGLGSGITSGAASMMFEHTDVVEINSAFFPLLRKIATANFAIADNPNARIIHDDARSYLAATHERYDAIVNSIPSPTYFAAGKIYTAEFFDMVKRALKPGGVYCSWFSPVDMSDEGLRTFLATLHSRFPVCNLAVLRNGYYFASCADAPLTIHVPAEDEFPGNVRDALGGLAGVSLNEYFESIFISDDIFRRMDLSGAPLNTDDFPIMEFQIMLRDRRNASPEQLPDPVVVDPGRFNVDLSGENARPLTRSVIFAQLHVPLFQHFYRPLLDRSPRLDEEFNRRMAGATEGAAATAPSR